MLDCTVIEPNAAAGPLPQNEPIGCDESWQCVASNDGDTSFVRSGTTISVGPRIDLYALADVTPRSEPIVRLRVGVVSRSVGGQSGVSASPQLSAPGQALVSGMSAALTTSYATITSTFNQNPLTSLPWMWSDINALRAGVSHSVLAADEARTTHVFVEICWQTPTPTPTLTRTPTVTPTITPTPTATPTSTASNTPTVTPTGATPATPTGTPSPTPSDTPTPLISSPTPSSTATGPTATVTATFTPSPSPSLTGTPPTSTPSAPPRISYLIARGDNEWECAFELQSNPPLLMSSGTLPMLNLSSADPVNLRSLYQAIYIAPSLGFADYDLLRQMSTLGGSIEQFVALGGVAVFNIGGTLGDQEAVAPGGVGFAMISQHDSQTILQPEHPYITGLGMGGEALDETSFDAWFPTDYGTLTNLPPDATILLQNNDGPSWAEYPYGAGRVIVTSLAYCIENRPASQQAATRNLFRYGRFYQGSAQTPAPTVTSTATFTATPSRTATRSRTPTPPATLSPTPTPTPVILPGDVNGDEEVDERDLIDLLAAIFANNPPALADVNGDGRVTAADVPALLGILFGGG
jgi:hypothetical protein